MRKGIVEVNFMKILGDLYGLNIKYPFVVGITDCPPNRKSDTATPSLIDLIISCPMEFPNYK